MAVECPKPVLLLREGDVAPCTGYLFSPAKEDEAYNAFQDAKYYKELSEKLTLRNELRDKQIDILNTRVNLYIQQSEVLASRVVDQESRSFWQNTFYFTLGVVITGVIAYGVVHGVK